jgi:DNA-binding transcriptional ArsR family regulator
MLIPVRYRYFGKRRSDVEEETQDFLKALASETRQQIMLLFAGGTQLTVGEVADACGLGLSTASEQLSILKRGGLVRSARDGKLVRYRADPTTITARLADLQSYLAGCCPPESSTDPGA